MWGEMLLSALVYSNLPFDKFGCAIGTIVRRHTIALNGARDEFPIPLYIISDWTGDPHRSEYQKTKVLESN